MKLNRLHTSLRKDFRSLPKPTTLDDFVGAFDARYVGPAPVRASGPLFMATLGFGGWKGKRFAPADDGLDGLSGMNRFAAGDPVDDKVPMRATIETSSVDGGAALVVTYPSDTQKPWNRARDEFREFEDGRLLGITTFDLPVVRHFPLAFVLERASG